MSGQKMAELLLRSYIALYPKSVAGRRGWEDIAKNVTQSMECVEMMRHISATRWCLRSSGGPALCAGAAAHAGAADGELRVSRDGPGRPESGDEFGLIRWVCEGKMNGEDFLSAPRVGAAGNLDLGGQK